MTTTTAWTDDINARLAAVETFANVNTSAWTSRNQAPASSKSADINARLDASHIRRAIATPTPASKKPTPTSASSIARIDRLFQVIIAFGSGIILTLLGVIIAIIVTA